MRRFPLLCQLNRLRPLTRLYVDSDVPKRQHGQLQRVPGLRNEAKGRLMARQLTRGRRRWPTPAVLAQTRYWR